MVYHRNSLLEADSYMARTFAASNIPLPVPGFGPDPLLTRTTGAALSPVLAGPLLAVPALAGAIFLVAGGLKLVYDLLLYRGFKASEGSESGP